MKLKNSNYNFFFDADDGYILAYNAFSNSLARIDKEEYKFIQEVLKDPNDLSSNSEKKIQLRKDLTKGSFLIEEELDEIELLKMSSKISRFSEEHLSLTIAPTLMCNGFCSYCFEKQKDDTMSKEVEEALIRFVKKRIEKIKSLHISWFGGEPTLRIDIIQRLVTELQKLCNENKVAFPPMSIITNGFLLSKDTATKLKALNITRAQVTIDGPQEIHDKRRKLKNGNGTFSTIIDNIKEAMDIISIYIRINLDRENYEAVEKVYDIFKENGFLNKVPFYFGQVQPSTDVCNDVSTVCFDTKEHSSIVVELLKKSRAAGFLNVRYPSSQNFGVCIADKLNGFVVSPSGLLYKCWSEISEDENHSVGSVFEDHLNATQLNNMARYINFDPFQNKDCLECGFLPICAGGCPYNALKSKEKKSCNNFRFNLEEMLRLKYDELKQRKNLENKL